MSRLRWGAFAALSVCTSACTAPVSTDLSEPAAAEIVVALEQNGLAAEKEADPDHEGRWQVLVSRDDASSALHLLQQEGLPPPTSPGLLDALGQGSLVESRTAEHARLLAGIAGELERSLRDVPGIVTARVHLAVPLRERWGAHERDPEATAAVLIRHRTPEPPVSPDEVRALVAGAVAELAPDRVAVVATRAGPLDPQTPVEWTHVGPITVAQTSLGPLRRIFGLIVTLYLALLAVLAVLWRRLRRRAATAAPDSAPPPPREPRP